MRSIAHMETAFARVPLPGDLHQAMASWGHLMDQLPVAIYICDRHGNLMKYNRLAAELWGRSPSIGDPSIKYCGAFKAYQSNGDILPLDKAPMSEVLRTRQAIRDREVIVERPDGSLITILANLDPLFNEEGEIIGGINCFHDISARKIAEQNLLRSQVRLRESEQRIRALLESLPMAVYTTDEKGFLTFYNGAASDLWGRDPELYKERWCGSLNIFTSEGQFLPREECPMAMALRENRPLREKEAVAERPDGTRIPFAAYPTPLYDAAGTLIGAVNMLVDLTHRKQAETRQQMLINELNHRVKNSLAIVQSIAAQSFRGKDPTNASQWFNARLLALAKAHDILTRENWEGADLRDIVLQGVAHLQDEREEKMRIHGPNVRLSPKTALSLAMILHELSTNAVKYGAFSVPEGSIAISWMVEKTQARERLRMRWQEQGGPGVAPPAHKGFGMHLIERGMNAEIGGETHMEFLKTGVICQITVPL